MPKIFSWKQSDSVDVELLDRQHQAMFKVVQELHEALSRAEGMQVAEDVFSRLMDYSTNHFEAEESLMEKQHYPRLKSHRAEHRAFADELQTFKEAFRAGNQNVVVNLLPYLQQWIKNHVQGADRQYGEYLKTRGDWRAEGAAR